MDPNGGNNPSSPRLDTNGAVPSQPMAPTDNLNLMAQPSVTAPVIQTPVDQPNEVPASPMAPSPSPLEGLNDLHTSSEPKGPIGGKGKVVAMIAIGSILVIGLVAGAFFVGMTNGRSQGKQLADAEYQKKEADRQKQEADAEANKNSDSESEKLDLGSDLVDAKYVDENVEGDIGKQLTASDGLVIKVTNIERNYKTTDPNYKLDATKELVKVNFLMGNIAKDKAKDITNFAFYLENSQQARLTPESIVSYPGKFDTVKLDPGSQSEGSIVYLVNKDEAPLKFIREQRYRFSGENREVTTRTIVTVADKQ